MTEQAKPTPWPLACKICGQGGFRSIGFGPTYQHDQEVCALNTAHAIDAERDRLKAENAELRDALREIAEGKGAYSQDPFEHARNCIDDMKGIASAAIAKHEARND